MPILEGYHHRGYLPHLKVSGAAYFVTFRLADSLPREVIARLKEQRDDRLHRATLASGHDENPATAGRLAQYAAEVDSVLDQHAGAAWLRLPRVAGLVANALRNFDGQRYILHAWCVMPNHVHAVLKPQAGYALETILHSWKSFTGSGANRLLTRTGEPFWQKESYDHWIRDDADFAHCIRYTEENPVTARLCSKAGDWPWSSAARK